MPHDAFLWPDQRDDSNSRPPYRDNIEDLVARDMNARETLFLALQDRLGNNTFGGGASDFFAFPHPSGGLRVRLNPGVRWDAATGQPVLTATQDSTTVTAPVGNPRYDILALDAAGAVTWITGTAAASPVLPSVGATQTPLWAVYLRPTTTTIDPFGYDLGTNSFLRHDLRSAVMRPLTSGVYTTIQDEASGLTQRSILNFTGAGVTAADNSGSGRTDVTIPGAAGGLALISDTVLGASAANFDLTSIAGTYKSLMLQVVARCDNAVTHQVMSLRFNNDSTAIYDYQVAQGNGATGSFAQTAAQTSGRIGVVTGSSAPANAAGLVVVEIPNYAATAFTKLAVSHGGDYFGTGTATTESDTVHWRSTVAISRITILPAAGNFIAGSRCTLYGIA